MNNSIAKQEAFLLMLHSGKIDSINAQVYRELVKHPQTIVYFIEVLKFKHQTCTAALSMLEDMGLVYKRETILIDKTSYSLWCAETNKGEARKRAMAIMQYKRSQWIERGLKQGWINKQIAQSIDTQLKLDLDNELEGGGFTP
jgi:predicted transcriptional regulator